MFKKLKEWFCKEENSLQNLIDEEDYSWKDIEVEKPPFDVVLGALDTYDCGWMIETTWWNEKEQCWMGNDADGISVSTRLNYTHWRLLPPPPKLDLDI